jgi:hypothetical protein
MRNNALLFLFLLAVTIGLIAYNRQYIPVKIISYPPSMFFIYFLRDIVILNKIYFLGRSIDYALMILIISILTKEIFVLNLAASAYLGLCLNDVYDELMNNNLVAYPVEYWFLLYAICIVLYKIHVHSHPEHKAGILFYRFRDFLLLKMFGYLSR